MTICEIQAYLTIEFTKITHLVSNIHEGYWNVKIEKSNETSFYFLFLQKRNMSIEAKLVCWLLEKQFGYSKKKRLLFLQNSFTGFN